MPWRRRVIRLLGALAAVALLAACGGNDDASTTTSTTAATTTTSDAPQAAPLTVMTRNLYLGADLGPLFAAGPDDLGAVARTVWDQIEASEIDARLAAVAAEIALSAPDVVALQEVSLYATQPEGASEPTVLHDFLETLLDELAGRGEDYSVAVSGDGFAGGLPVEGLGFITLQDRDVILVRDDRVVVTRTDSGVFDAKLALEVAGIPLELARGWAAIEATVDGRAFALVNTHLEAFGDETRDAQQAELVAVVGAFPDPTVVLGDLNSNASGAGAAAATYEAMIAGGYVDAWSAQDSEGPTCCYSADLLGGDLDQRIDFVFLHGDLAAESTSLVGVDAAHRTPGGRWPSDHAGVLATVRVAS